MRYKITNWNGEKSFDLVIVSGFGEYLGVGHIYSKELELNLKYQLT